MQTRCPCNSPEPPTPTIGCCKHSRGRQAYQMPSVMHLDPPEVDKAPLCEVARVSVRNKHVSKQGPERSHRHIAAVTAPDVQDSLPPVDGNLPGDFLQSTLPNPAPRTFGNIVCSILFRPEVVISTANTVPTTHLDFPEGLFTTPGMSSPVECTLFELQASVIAVLGSQSPDIRRSNVNKVFSSDLAVSALTLTLMDFGQSPEVVGAVVCFSRALVGAEGRPVVAVKTCHMHLCSVLASAASVLQYKFGSEAANFSAAATAIAAELSAAAPTEVLLQHLDVVKQLTLAAASAAHSPAVGSYSAAADGLIPAALQMLARSCRTAELPREVLLLLSGSAGYSPAAWPGRKVVYVWEELRCWKPLLQLLSAALVHPNETIRDTAHHIMQDMVNRSQNGGFVAGLEIEQFAAGTTAAVESICSASCKDPTAYTSTATSGGSTAAGQEPFDSIRAAALGMLLTVQLNLCTAADSDNASQDFAAQLLQPEQQKVYSILPGQLKVVQVLNAALAVILQADDRSALVPACSLVKHLIAASAQLQDHTAGTLLLPADPDRSQQYKDCSTKHNAESLQLQEKHFPLLEVVPKSVKQQLKQARAKPGWFASLAGCVCCCVVPESFNDWDARLATAVVLQPRHGMNSSAVFERELSNTAGLFSSRRLRKLVKLQNRNIVM